MNRPVPMDAPTRGFGFVQLNPSELTKALAAHAAGLTSGGDVLSMETKHVLDRLSEGSESDSSAECVGPGEREGAASEDNESALPGLGCSCQHAKQRLSWAWRSKNGVWRSLVARGVWDAEAGGSNPPAPTINLSADSVRTGCVQSGCWPSPLSRAVRILLTSSLAESGVSSTATRAPTPWSAFTKSMFSVWSAGV